MLADDDGAHRGTIALIDHGHTRIGYLGNALSIFTGERRYAGLRACARRTRTRCRPEHRRREPADRRPAREATRHSSGLEHPPTAIFCANNRNAIGALKEISAQLNAGSRAAADFPEIMSFDDFELAELSPVPISVIDHDPRELGRTVTRLLLDRLDGGDRDAAPREIELPVSLRSVR